MKTKGAICALALVTAHISAAPVVFQVDMGPLISMGIVDPSTVLVEARGSFQDPTWSTGFFLTNSDLTPNIFSGTFDVQGTAGSNFEYKFVYDNALCGGVTWESRNNRSFVLQAGGQTLPVVFYNDVATPPAARDVTFLVDVAVPISKGTFDPSTGLVEARGSFQSPCTWSGGFPLTNSPSQPNIYSGTYSVRNTAPGANIEYKFVLNGGTWESIDNRVTPMPSASTNLPVVPFNNELLTGVPVTFQVDLTAQIISGQWDPSSGYVEARGSFQNPAWSAGFVLTNNPAGPNTNVYSGTYEVSQAPGTRISYKFYASGIEWEQPASTGGGNRGFTLGILPQTLPTVFFSDFASGDLLTLDTLVTFKVDMTNAQAIAWNSNPSFQFNPATDSVYINGEFLGWWSWGLGAPPEQYKLTNAPGSRVYSTTILVPKNRALALTYKYSINGGDNEAPSGQNHLRYIRNLGTYVMPLDTFGTQIIEPASGDLAIRPSPPGSIVMTWLGRPGIALESSTSLSGPWTEVSGTDGASSTVQGVVGNQRYYRLLQK